MLFVIEFYVTNYTDYQTNNRRASCQICVATISRDVSGIVFASIGGVTSRGDGIPDAVLCERYISHEMGQLRRGSDSYVTVTPDLSTDMNQCYVSRLYRRKRNDLVSVSRACDICITRPTCA